MNEALFNKFAKIAYDQAGVHLRPGKESLVSARVAKRLRALGLENPRDYLDFLEKDKSGEEIVQFLDVITTNFTSFFREPEHFDILTEVLKKWRSENQKRFRIWSAASSSGEEPYSIGMTVIEEFENSGCDIKILATDISTKVLQKASDGLYPTANIKGVSQNLSLKYFDKTSVETKRGTVPHLRVKKKLRDALVFKRLNLSKPPFPMTGPLDVVFCRNVMIYFDNKVRQRLVSEIERLLRPDGLLLIGHTETLTSLNTNFIAVKPSVYRKPLR